MRFPSQFGLLTLLLALCSSCASAPVDSNAAKVAVLLRSEIPATFEDCGAGGQLDFRTTLTDEAGVRGLQAQAARLSANVVLMLRPTNERYSDNDLSSADIGTQETGIAQVPPIERSFKGAAFKCTSAETLKKIASDPQRVRFQ